MVELAVASFVSLRHPEPALWVAGDGNDQTHVAPALLPVLVSSRRTLRRRQECLRHTILARTQPKSIHSSRSVSFGASQMDPTDDGESILLKKQSFPVRSITVGGALRQSRAGLPASAIPQSWAWECPDEIS